ncbi:MAG: hypothetical protein LRY68_01455, partial [Sulfurospirillum sp.]|nr:hypothetical protein [Sulfurospirillum sp.]
MLDTNLEHFEKACENTPFQSLHVSTQSFVKTKALAYHLSFSQIQQFIIMAVDMQMWDEKIEAFWVDKESKK